MMLLVISVSCTGIHYVWRCGVVPNFLVLKLFPNYGRGEGGGPRSATKYGAAQFKEWWSAWQLMVISMLAAFTLLSFLGFGRAWNYRIATFFSISDVFILIYFCFKMLGRLLVIFCRKRLVSTTDRMLRLNWWSWQSFGLAPQPIRSWPRSRDVIVSWAITSSDHLDWNRNRCSATS